MRLPRFRPLFTLLFVFFLPGCGSIYPQLGPITSDSLEGCQKFVSQLENQVMDAGVREASSALIPGFPYLRTNRFLSAMKNRIRDEEGMEQWLQWMKTLDLQARNKEIDNLPDDRVRPLQTFETGQPNRKEVYTRVDSCSEKLFRHDKALADFSVTLFPKVEVPSEYSFLKRAIGLYPLMAVPVAVLSRHAEAKNRSWFEMGLDQLPVLGQLKAYAPLQHHALQEEEIRTLFEDSRVNALGVPLPDEGQRKRLAWSFAPILIQDVAATYDRLGQVVWKGNRLEIDPERPTLYYYFSHAFLKGKPILQINYVIWHSDRAGETPPWTEKGHMDGITYVFPWTLRGRFLWLT